MKVFAVAAGVAALLGSFQSLQQGGSGDAVAAGHAEARGLYRLIANGGATTCTVVRGAKLAGGLSELAVGPECRAMLPGIERARFWRERADGSVGFSENGIDPLVSFEAGDGVDYESYAPASPLLALVAE